MGVHGLWNLLEPVGKPVPLESLENKVLAVDVSIWLHQATKGFRDAQGNPLPNAHLLGLCHRLCKLLFYKIKPIFVFDGGVPLLKRQTIAARQSRRNASIQTNNKIAEKILANYVKSEVINKELGKQGKGKSLLPRKKQQEPDLFELPPQTHIQDQQSESEYSDGVEEIGDLSMYLRGHTVHSVDVTSAEFLSLPPEIQHEILLELKDTRKQSSWNRINQMPQEARDFSGFQVERLLRRRNLQQRLNEVEKEISRKKHECFDIDALDASSVVTERILSDSSTHYVLIKKALEKKEFVDSKKEEKESRPVSRVEPVIHSLSDEEDLTQEEILAIVKSKVKDMEAQSQTVIQMMPSTSEEDSDFEEVLENVSNEPKVVFSVPIDLNELTSDEDMFADVFGDVHSEPASAVPLVTSDMLEANFSRQPNLVAGCMSHNEPIVAELFQKDVGKSEVQSIELLNSSDESLLAEEYNFKQPGYLNTNSVTSTGITDASSSIIPEQLSKQPVIDIDLVKGKQATKLIREATTTVEIELNEFENKTLSEISRSPTIGAKDKILHTKSEEFEAVPEEAIVTLETINSSVTSEANVKEPPVSEKGSAEPSEAILAVEKNFEDSPAPLPVLDQGYRERLEEMDRLLYEEQYSLVKERGRQERLATTMTEQIYTESQEMLRYFGIPYIVAPMEAEAQCAYFDEVGITQGTITDDSDIWLFGGRRVYKNFFNQSKYVEFFEIDDVQKLFKMKRQQLISLALLTGSDYTEGLQGVGPVYALEILAEFPGEGLEQLENFRDWLSRMQNVKNAPPGSKFREKLRNLKLIPGENFFF